MRSAFFLNFAAMIMAVLAILVVLMLWLLHRSWWRKKYIRVTLFSFLGASTLSVVVWTIGVHTRSGATAFLGGSMTAAMLLLLVGMAVTLPLSGLIHIGVDISAKFGKRRKEDDEKSSVSRREFIKNSAAVIPALALTAQLGGIAESYGSIHVPVIELPVANLPEKLQGLKIAHLSDSHLGIYKHLDDLEKAVERIRSHEPDLVLYSGDISDDLKILARVNEIVASLNPPFGIFASVGNHEYYRGIKRVLQIFEKSPYPLLLEEGVSLVINDVPVYIGGANDPVHLRGVAPDFLLRSIEKTMRDAPSDSFKIVMSHRPRGFDPAADLGMNLVLAGHTHGAQIGFAHRSLFESVWPEMYLWGIYRKKNTTLYTSGGMGHWLPFRLGCPAEAPILILEKSTETDSV